jgi:hypothetical protein
MSKINKEKGLIQKEEEKNKKGWQTNDLWRNERNVRVKMTFLYLQLYYLNIKFILLYI